MLNSLCNLLNSVLKGENKKVCLGTEWLAVCWLFMPVILCLMGAAAANPAQHQEKSIILHLTCSRKDQNSKFEVVSLVAQTVKNLPAMQEPQV